LALTHVQRAELFTRFPAKVFADCEILVLKDITWEVREVEEEPQEDVSSRRRKHLAQQKQISHFAYLSYFYYSEIEKIRALASDDLT
jgi:hypothetical protein